MTQQQKTIKLAEFEGWKFRKATFWEKILSLGLLRWITTTPKGQELCGYYPRYFTDLNAVHELEKVFTWDDISTPDPEREGCTYHTNTKAQYQRTLADVIAKEKEQEGMDSLKAFLFGIQESVHATAAHRAEAIGQTLKLW